ncbi:MAG: class I SAM-dependent methyltransferase [bacterium]|nr:class I SAM-dependent methyltransferase [bacterium]
MTGLYQEISNRVRDQYEKYPYPDIDPDGQQPQMLVSGHLSLMCDILWAGKKSPDRLRVLDAGCGTGSPLTAMALAYPNADIAGVDFSEASLAKARRLVQRYQVRNVRLFHLPIEQLHKLGMTFDLVVSSGVLHHLPEPARGLKAIGEVLDPQGAVSIMLYGKYGRTGIYMLQEALKHTFEPWDTIEEKISFALHLARGVPPHHPMARRAKGRELQEGKDSGVVDLLLHANDIPFDVPAVYRMCEDAGMCFHRWLFPLIYEPRNYFNDPLLRESFENLSPRERYEIAELMHGTNAKHSFFAVGPEFSPPDIRITGGNWRNLRAKLTPCLAWNRTAPVPNDRREEERFLIPPAIIQDAWGPLEVSRWQLMFLGQILPERSLGQVVRMPDVRKALPFKSPAAIDGGVEKLLQNVLDNLGIVLLKK